MSEKIDKHSGSCDRPNPKILKVLTEMLFLKDVFDMLIDVGDEETALDARNRAIDSLKDCGYKEEDVQKIIQQAVAVFATDHLESKEVTKS